MMLFLLNNDKNKEFKHVAVCDESHRWPRHETRTQDRLHHSRKLRDRPIQVYCITALYDLNRYINKMFNTLTKVVFASNLNYTQQPLIYKMGTALPPF